MAGIQHCIQYYIGNPWRASD